MTFCSSIPSSPLVCRLALTGVQSYCKLWLQQHSACQARIRCSWRHPFPSLLAEAALPDHKSHLDLFTWLSSLWHRHAWMQASGIQMGSLQTGGDLRVRATGRCARFLLPMASFERMYLSFSHLSFLSSYKHHHLCLTWAPSQAAPFRGCCNEALEHTRARAGCKDPWTQFLCDSGCLHMLPDKWKLLRALPGSPNGGETARILRMDKISCQEFMQSTTEKQTIHKRFQKIVYPDKQSESGLLRWDPANGVQAL